MGTQCQHPLANVFELIIAEHEDVTTEEVRFFSISPIQPHLDLHFLLII